MTFLRRLARKYISLENRVRIGRVPKSAARKTAGSAALLLGAILRVLPAQVLIGLRDRLELRCKLDFPDAPLRIHVTSDIEYHTRLWSCRKEPETVEWLRRAVAGEGSVLYDIGANIGAYSLIAGELLRGRNGLVYAFEPGFKSYANLVANIALNGLEDSVVAMPLAVNDRTGIATFRYSGTSAGSADHAGVVEGGSGSALSQSLLGCTLDDVVRLFALRLPTAIKIDVDGAEENVLAGGTDVFRQPQLKHILIEVDEESTSAAGIRQRFETAGFRVDAVHLRGQGGMRNVIWTRA